MNKKIIFPILMSFSASVFSEDTKITNSIDFGGQRLASRGDTLHPQTGEFYPGESRTSGTVDFSLDQNIQLVDFNKVCISGKVRAYDSYARKPGWVAVKLPSSSEQILKWDIAKVGMFEYCTEREDLSNEIYNNIVHQIKSGSSLDVEVFLSGNGGFEMELNGLDIYYSGIESETSSDDYVLVNTNEHTVTSDGALSTRTIDSGVTYLVKVIENNATHDGLGHSFSNIGISYVDSNGDRVIASVDASDTYITTNGEVSFFFVDADYEQSGTAKISLKRVNID